MSALAVETYETRTPDAEGWRGVPFRHPADMEADGGKHDGGPMPPEAPREPQPQGGDGT
ncbi:hypothetical protein [Streptomyces tubercidicus]|uniref:hypothetical protein n=1 Tax=Streptomyces tubercidicus TaxID=47759 RepID=UPI002E0E6987|nr:hypothetical protein OG761_16170 [Streptomyces tubercidicus]